MMDNTSQTPQLVAGRYRVDRLIARGGMGSVFLCHDLELPRPVAVKVLRPGADAEGSGRFVDRFHLEAKTLASLNHNNIVTLYDYGQTDDGQFYLALEYIEGPRFTDLVRQGPLSAERATELILQVCRALRYAHKRGVVHRDLKPSNLLIRVDDDGEEQVKVVDFGLVKVLEGDDQSLTRAGLILGSPHCMAPEQIRGQDVDHRADIYAMGVLLYRAVVGQWPFHGESSTATMIAHINQPIPPFQSMNVDLVVPEGFESIVRRCLQKAPADRYPDVPALMADLRALVGRQQTVTISEHPSVHDASIVTGSRSALRSLSATVPDPTATAAAPGEATGALPGPSRRPPLVAAAIGAGVALLLMLSCSGMFLLGSLFARQSGPAAAPGVVPAPVAPAASAEGLGQGAPPAAEAEADADGAAGEDAGTDEDAGTAEDAGTDEDAGTGAAAAPETPAPAPSPAPAPARKAAPPPAARSAPPPAAPPPAPDPAPAPEAAPAEPPPADEAYMGLDEWEDG